MAQGMARLMARFDVLMLMTNQDKQSASRLSQLRFISESTVVWTLLGRNCSLVMDEAAGGCIYRDTVGPATMQAEEPSHLCS